MNDETDREVCHAYRHRHRRDTNASVVLNKLYKMTMLQTSFGAEQRVALVQPSASAQP